MTYSKCSKDYSGIIWYDISGNANNNTKPLLSTYCILSTVFSALEIGIGLNYFLQQLWGRTKPGLYSISFSFFSVVPCSRWDPSFPIREFKSLAVEAWGLNHWTVCIKPRLEAQREVTCPRSHSLQGDESDSNLRSLAPEFKLSTQCILTLCPPHWLVARNKVTQRCLAYSKH